MKLVDKMNAFIFFAFVGCMIGVIIYGTFKSEIIDSKNAIIMVADTSQRFPMTLNKNFEITSAKVKEDNLIVVIKDKFNGSEYQSSLPYQDLENKICGDYVYRKQYWNCSDENKKIKSMILELGYQSLKLL